MGTNDELLNNLQTFFQQNVPFSQFIGLEIDSVEEGYSKISLEAGHNLSNSLGVVHGGVLSLLADFSGAISIRTILGTKVTFSTVELKINYLEPAVLGEIFAEGRVIRCGSTIAVTSVDIRDSMEKLVATGLATYMISRRKSKDYQQP